MSDLKKSFAVEIALLQALACRQNYDDYISYVDTAKVFEETRTLVEAYKYYYDMYPDHRDIDWNTFLTQFVSNWHARDMHEEQIDDYTNAIQTLSKSDKADSEKAIMGLINKQLIDRLVKIAEKPFTSEHLRQEIEGYEKKCASIFQEQDKDCYTSDDVDFTAIDKSLGIPYAHEPLQDALGGKVKGSLIIVAGAHGLGKTAWVHTDLIAALKWAKKHQAGPILFFNTEGTPSEVFGRFWSNLYCEQFPEGYREIILNKQKVQAHWNKTFGKESLRVFNANNKGVNYLRLKIKQYNPCFVVLDMAAAIMTSASKNSGETQDLKVFFNALREMSSLYCPIMATVQAGVGAKWWDKDQQKYLYKQWPTSEDLYGSKDAIQGAAETIITIGRDNEHPLTRYIQTTKLKAECDPVKYTCELVKRYSKYELISKFGG